MLPTRMPSTPSSCNHSFSSATSESTARTDATTGEASSRGMAENPNLASDYIQPADAPRGFDRTGRMLPRKGTLSAATFTIREETIAVVKPLLTGPKTTYVIGHITRYVALTAGLGGLGLMIYGIADGGIKHKQFVNNGQAHPGDVTDSFLAHYGPRIAGEVIGGAAITCLGATIDFVGRKLIKRSDIPTNDELIGVPFDCDQDIEAVRPAAVQIP